MDPCVRRTNFYHSIVAGSYSSISRCLFVLYKSRQYIASDLLEKGSLSLLSDFFPHPSMLGYKFIMAYMIVFFSKFSFRSPVSLVDVWTVVHVCNRQLWIMLPKRFLRVIMFVHVLRFRYTCVIDSSGSCCRNISCTLSCPYMVCVLGTNGIFQLEPRTQQ